MRGIGYLEASVQRPDTAIRSGDIDYLAISLARMRINSISSISGPETAVIIVFSDRDFL